MAYTKKKKNQYTLCNISSSNDLPKLQVAVPITHYYGKSQCINDNFSKGLS